MRGFLDNCISPKIGQLLQAVEFDVVHLRAEFDASTPDTEWIPLVASKGWFIVTQDANIKRRVHEQRAVRDAGAIVFVLAKGYMSLSLNLMGSKLLEHWPRIEAAARKARRGEFHLVSLSGKVERF